MSQVTEKEGALEKIITDLTRQDVINYILRAVDKLEGYWKFIYRTLVLEGFQVKTEVSTDIDYVEGKDEGYYAVTWSLKILIPESLIEFIAAMRRKKIIKIKKPHPVIRQRYRRQEAIGSEFLVQAERAEKIAREISEKTEKEVSKVGGVDG